MASILDDESLLDIQRTSLLDVVEEKNKTLNKKYLMHRMVVVSKNRHAEFQDMGSSYEKLLKDLCTHYQMEPATGLLLLYPKHSVHIIESSQEILLDVLRELRKDEESGGGHVVKSKILIVSHDIPHRLYQAWTFRIIDIEALLSDDYEAMNNPEELVTDMLTQLLKLGAYISRQPKVAVNKTLESLHEKVPELMPQQDAMGYLMERDEPCVVLPSEYLAKYEQPYDIVLKSELVWPMPVGVFPYN